MTNPIRVGDNVNITIRNAVVCDLGDPEDDPGQALISATYERTGTADVDYVSVNPTSDAVTIQPASADPDDYYSRLAAELHKVADQIATLTGSPVTPRYVSLTFCAGLLDYEAAKAVPLVDTIAAALGVAAVTEQGNGEHWQHLARQERDPLTVKAYAAIPAPRTRQQRMADLEAENARLRAQLAQANCACNSGDDENCGGH